MKIAVQGTFIDTESIYSIGEIYTDHYENEVYCFDIHHFGGENKTVHIKKYNAEKEMEYQQFCCDSNKKLDECSIDEVSKRIELRELILSTNKDRLEKMRLDIVDIWKANQSTVPSFNVENY